MRWKFVLAVLLLIVIGGAATAEEIRIVAAADLNYVFRDIAARFEKETGNKVDLIFGSSGNFYSQIQSGAPFDLFFSADIQYPEKLESANADAGILAVSLALAPEMKSSGRYVAIPESEYPPMKQAAIIVASSKNKATARLFLDFLKKPEIVKVMETYGFGVSLK